VASSAEAYDKMKLVCRDWVREVWAIRREDKIKEGRPKTQGWGPG